MAKLMQPSEAWEGLSSRTLLMVLELVLATQVPIAGAGAAAGAADRSRNLPNMERAAAWRKAGDIIMGAFPAPAFGPAFAFGPVGVPVLGPGLALRPVFGAAGAAGNL